MQLPDLINYYPLSVNNRANQARFFFINEFSINIILKVNLNHLLKYGT